MSPLLRTVRDIQVALAPIAALCLILTACVLAFRSPDRVDLIGLFLATGTALTDPTGRRQVRAADRRSGD